MKDFWTALSNDHKSAVLFVGIVVAILTTGTVCLTVLVIALHNYPVVL